MSDLARVPDYQDLHAAYRRRLWRAGVSAGLLALVIASAFVYADAFNPVRYIDALPTILQLVADALPPDFSRWQSWGRPLAETLSMSVAGTVLGALMAAPLAPLAARTLVGSLVIGGAVRLILNVLRSIPGLIWGVLFVAAVGFGPLPGILALAFHSTGMLGRLYAETLEHVETAPGDALRAQGVPLLGVLRFSILPQILPRLVDVTLYRLEHNLRAATTLGVVGAGGLGLEITTAFHLFEYREASALILVLLALVAVITFAGGQLRRHFLAFERT